MAERSRSVSNGSSNGNSNSATSRPTTATKPPTPSRPSQSSSSQSTRDKKSKSSLQSIKRTLSFRTKKKPAEIRIVNAQPYNNLVANGPTSPPPPPPPTQSVSRSTRNSSRFFVPESNHTSNSRGGPTVIRPRKNNPPPRPPPPNVRPANGVNGGPPSYSTRDRDQDAWATFMDEAAAAPLARQNARAVSVPNLARKPPQPAPRSAVTHVTTISTLSKSTDTLSSRQRPRVPAAVATGPVVEAPLIDLSTPPGSPARQRPPPITLRPKSMIDLEQVFSMVPNDRSQVTCNGHATDALVPMPAPRRTAASGATATSDSMGDVWLENCLQGSSGLGNTNDGRPRSPPRTSPNGTSVPGSSAPGTSAPPLPPRPKHYNTSRAYAIAIYDYQSQQHDELSFKTGDNIILIHRVNAEWIYGCLGSREGMFPQNFVNIQVPLPGDADFFKTRMALPSGPCCVAIFDFMGEEETELSFRTGDVIALESRVGTEWLRGSLHGHSGLLPASYVNVVRDLPDVPDVPTGKLCSSTPKHHHHNHNHSAKDGASRCCTQGTWKYCVALYEFRGEGGELSFKEGEEFVVTSEIDSDWLMGKLRDGSEGRFPRNFVMLK